MNRRPFKYDSIPIFSQSIFRDIFSGYFTKSLGFTSLFTAAVVDAKTVTLVSGHGSVAGNLLVLAYLGNVYTGEILNVATDVITLDNPINFAFPTDSIVLKADREMNVDGSSTSVIFRFTPPTGVIGSVWSITRLMFTMICDSLPDDGLFGNIAKLTNGITFRIKRNSGVILQKSDFKDNSDFAAEAFDVVYTTRSVPSGSYGMRCRYSFGGDDKHGNPIVLDDNVGDSLEIIVQDDLTDLTQFRVLAQGTILFGGLENE